MPTAAAIYARISKDDEGDELGVHRQEADCRALAERKGWPVAGLYVDNDRSAFSGKVRPEYVRLLDDVRAGRVDAVVACHPDRLTRSVRELEDFVDAVEAGAVSVATVSAGDLDLSTPSGKLVARIVGSVARHESEHQAAKLRRKHLELAKAGKPSGGGARPFGYAPGGLVVIESEAEMIREAARRFLAGDTITNIARSWNAAGLRTASGKQWRVSPMRQILMSARVAGLREHHGEIVGDAVWPAILDRGTWERIRARFADPSRRQSPPVRTNLLGGILYCARCGGKLTTGVKTRRRAYACHVGPGKPNCGRLQIVAEPLEDLVVEAVMLRLDTVDLARAVTGVDEQGDLDRLTTLERRLDELAESFAAGEITRRQMAAATVKINQGIAEARRRLAGTRGGDALASVTDVGPLRQAWPELNLQRRTAVLRAVIECIEIAPTSLRGLRSFDPRRVNVVWRDQL